VKRLVFLVEEPSIAEVLDIILPRFLPEDVAHQVVPHQGKNDLEKSIPRKLLGWKEPEVYFIVVRDNDGSDCKALKAKLTAICDKSGRSDTVVRIVCQELEAWYLGDLAAVAVAYQKPTLVHLQQKQAYRNPDRMTSPSQRMHELVPEFAKIAGAQAIAPHMNLISNCSRSFQVFMDGVKRLAFEPLDKKVQPASVQTTLSFPGVEAVDSD